jgi:hypothetical protein
MEGIKACYKGIFIFFVKDEVNEDGKSLIFYISQIK